MEAGRLKVDTPTTMNEYITCSCFWLGYLIFALYTMYLWFEAIGETSW